MIGEFRRTLLPVAELGELVGRDPSCFHRFGCVEMAQPFDSAHQCSIGHQLKVPFELDDIGMGSVVDLRRGCDEVMRDRFRGVRDGVDHD